jgi:protein-disulfide isomerase
MNMKRATAPSPTTSTAPSSHAVGGRLRPDVTGRDHSQGPVNAPVTLVEYGDYQCPYCCQAHPLVKALQQRLGDAGSPFRFVFRNFPLTEIHPWALHAAEAAESVAAHGGDAAFWAMHDTIFANQRDSVSALSDQKLAEYAETVGVDAVLVARDLKHGVHEARVRVDFMGGVRSGVNGTPTFFINGARFDGDWTDADAFARALEDAVAVASGR